MYIYTYISPSLIFSIILHVENITGMLAVIGANGNNTLLKTYEQTNILRARTSLYLNLYVNNGFSMNCLFKCCILLFKLFR